jgi:hypothetical protein
VVEVTNILLGPLIAQNLIDTKRPISVQEPTVTEVARGDYESNKNQELVAAEITTAKVSILGLEAAATNQ